MYVTGLGDSGQLGLGTERSQKSSLILTLIPFQYEDYNIVSITAGIAHNSKSLEVYTLSPLPLHLCNSSADRLWQGVHIWSWVSRPAWTWRNQEPLPGKWDLCYIVAP